MGFYDKYLSENADRQDTSAPAANEGSFYDRYSAERGISPADYAARSHAAGLAAGRTAEEQADVLRKRGISESAIGPLIQNYKLDLAEQNLGRFPGGKETIAGSVARQMVEHGTPFRSLFVDTAKEEQDAQARFQAGQATDADVKTLAL